MIVCFSNKFMFMFMFSNELQIREIVLNFFCLCFDFLILTETLRVKMGYLSIYGVSLLYLAMTCNFQRRYKFTTSLNRTFSNFCWPFPNFVGIESVLNTNFSELTKESH